eukprot:TRINITY_DN23428_c0_g1_i1.p1 TRINITY_DN23428_c0_g1~~TRINITY_DN23428_c0_g1_i1.p1  ORF type:complete len:297 (-),score=74.69 TRINITY_DN23428_c0_g1_i1:101-991(-)
MAESADPWRKRHSAAQVARHFGELNSQESARQLFSQFDTDGTGRIAKDELLKVLKQLMPELEAPDVNNDLEVDYHEFVSWVLSGQRRKTLAESLGLDQTTPEKRLNRLFRKFDVDGNGTISQAELQSILQLLGSDFSPGDCCDFFKQGDVNGDGLVDYAEFLKLVFEGESRYTARESISLKQETKIGKHKMDPSSVYYSRDTVASRFQLCDGSKLAALSLAKVSESVNSGELYYLDDLPMLQVVFFQSKYFAMTDADNRVLHVLQTCFGGEKLWVNIHEAPAKFSVRGDGMNVDLI